MTGPSLNRRTLVAGGAVTVMGGLLASRLAVAQTPTGDPTSSPAASPAASFPEGPLGTALAWLQDALNTPGGPPEDPVTAAFSPAALATPPAADVASLIATFADAGGPWTIDTATMIMTMDFPPTNAGFFIDEPGGRRLRGGISIDRDSGLIGAFSLEDADTAATPEASPAG